MKNITQQELSISAEVFRKSINAIENGVYIPSTVLALKIVRILNCKVEDIFFTKFQITGNMSYRAFKIY